MPTSNQKNILEKIGVNKENEKVISQLMGKSPDAIRMSQTEIFQEFLEDLDLMIRFYPIFEQRFKLKERRTPRGEEGVYTKLRRLARLIRKEAG